MRFIYDLICAQTILVVAAKLDTAQETRGFHQGYIAVSHADGQPVHVRFRCNLRPFCKEGAAGSEPLSGSEPIRIWSDVWGGSDES